MSKPSDDELRERAEEYGHITPMSSGELSDFFYAALTRVRDEAQEAGFDECRERAAQMCAEAGINGVGNAIRALAAREVKP